MRNKLTYQARNFLTTLFRRLDSFYMQLGRFFQADYLHALLFSTFAIIQFYFLFRGVDQATGLDVITSTPTLKFIISMCLIYFSIFILIVRNEYTILISQVLVYFYVFSLANGILTGRISVVGVTAITYLIFGSFGIANSVYHARQNAKLQRKLEEGIAAMYALKEIRANDRTNNTKSA